MQIYQLQIKLVEDIFPRGFLNNEAQDGILQNYQIRTKNYQR